jgi:hypothetical protein
MMNSRWARREARAGGGEIGAGCNTGKSVLLVHYPEPTVEVTESLAARIFWRAEHRVELGGSRGVKDRVQNPAFLECERSDAVANPHFVRSQIDPNHFSVSLPEEQKRIWGNISNPVAPTFPMSGEPLSHGVQLRRRKLGLVLAVHHHPSVRHKSRMNRRQLNAAAGEQQTEENDDQSENLH